MPLGWPQKRPDNRIWYDIQLHICKWYHHMVHSTYTMCHVPFYIEQLKKWQLCMIETPSPIPRVCLSEVRLSICVCVCVWGMCINYQHQTLSQQWQHQAAALLTVKSCTVAATYRIKLRITTECRTFPILCNRIRNVPKLPPSPWGFKHSPNTRFPGRNRGHISNGISTGAARGCDQQTERQTDRQTTLHL